MFYKGGRMKNQEAKIEKAQLIFNEALLMVKGVLATKSCIIDEDLQMRDGTDYYYLLRRINALLTNIRHTLDS